MPGDVDEFVDGGGRSWRAAPQIAQALGRNARAAVIDHYSWRRHVERLWQRAPARLRATGRRRARRCRSIATGDAYKEQVQNQWNNNPVGSHYAPGTQPHTLEWFLEVEAHRYGVYGPWMPDVMEFARMRGEQRARDRRRHGHRPRAVRETWRRVTDVDLSAGHLQLAQENFACAA